MDDLLHVTKPSKADEIVEKARQRGFTMSCDDLTGNLLRTLVATKRNGKVLELGTGVGYSTSWLLEGMDHQSTLISVESEEDYAEVAAATLGNDPRLKLVVSDGGTFIQENAHLKFDFIFADTWPGKFYLLDEVIDMLEHHGILVLDDLNPQPGWPDGHGEKVSALIAQLDQRSDLRILKLDWSTGIIIATKS